MDDSAIAFKAFKEGQKGKHHPIWGGKDVEDAWYAGIEWQKAQPNKHPEYENPTLQAFHEAMEPRTQNLAHADIMQTAISNGADGFQTGQQLVSINGGPFRIKSGLY